MADIKKSYSQLVAEKEAASRIILGSGCGETLSEELPSYAPKYPHNTVLVESEAGHLIEIDDTDDAERIHIYHTRGSHIEMRPDGGVKYKTVKKRQDVTIGDHEILIKGDWNIIVEGGYNLHVNNGELVIHAEDDAAINVKGKLQISAESIELQADKNIFLNAPKVDLGGPMPLMSLPSGITMNEKWPFDPTFVPKVRIPLSPAGMSKLNEVNKSLKTEAPAMQTSVAASKTKISGVSKNIEKLNLNNLKSRSNSYTGDADTEARKQIDELQEKINKLAVAVAAGFGTVASVFTKPDVPDAKKVAKILSDEAVDAAGEPFESKLTEQPGELPLSHPPLYRSPAALAAAGATTSAIVYAKQRGRQFDSPEDVNNSDSYSAHINLSAELGDFKTDAKKSPGAILQSDTTTPAPEPAPAMPFNLPSGGTVQLTNKSTLVVGTGTKFTEDLDSGQIITIGGANGVIATVASDTQLVLAEPWAGSTTSGAVKVYRLRPMQEFFGKFTYSDTATLGQSGLRLADLMVGFTSPVIEVPQINPALLGSVAGGEGTGAGASDGECGTPANIPDPGIAKFYDPATMDLTDPTYEGSGKFVEAVVAGLGEEWGHVSKSGAQTQWNRHAVDAIMYKSPTPLYNGMSYQVFDIIASSGGPDAKVQWVPVCAPDDGARWGGKG